MADGRPPAVAPGAPRRFGRYTILAQLPEGGSGQVYLVQKDGDADLCVLKRLRLELRDHETASRRLYREAHLAAYLHHPNIARIIDAGQEEGTFYLVVEFVAGQELSRLLDRLADARSKLPPEATLRIALDVLAGLEYAHDAVDPEGRPLHIVHRDIGPRNVMVGFDGGVKIIDFGAARGQLDDFQSLPGTLIGTPRYMPPETVLGQPVDRRADLYSFCALLFEMFSGEMLVPQGNFVEVLSWIAQQKPPLLSDVAADLPRGLDEVLSIGLAKRPESRWQTAAELRARLLDATSSIRPATNAELGRLLGEQFPEVHTWVSDLRVLAGARGKRSTFTATVDDMPALSLAMPGTDDLHEGPTTIEHSFSQSGTPTASGTDRTPAMVERPHVISAKMPLEVIHAPRIPDAARARPAPLSVDRARPMTPSTLPPQEEPTKRGWLILAWLALSLMLLGFSLALYAGGWAFLKS